MTSFLLTAALLVFVGFSATYGQDPIISPLVIEGREEATVMFVCDSGVMNGGFGISVSVFDEMVNDFIGSTDDRLVGAVDGQFVNFTFGPLMASDNNTLFRCSSSRGRSEVAVISVIFAPIIGRLSPLGDPIAVREGQAVTVELNVSANPQPNSYNWTHLRDDMIRVVTNENGITRRLDSVTFNPASRNHSGEYRLVINNSAGSSEYNFTLDVQYPPTFPVEFVSPNTFNCSRDGEMFECASYPGVSATLFCNASGNPLPTVNRSLSGVSNQSNIDLVSGRDITITLVNRDNAGTHACVATSQLFQETITITRTFRLYVGGVAQPLSDVEARIGDSIVMVTWSYNNSRAVNPVSAQYFVVTVSLDGVQTQESPFMVNINTTSITIPGELLQPGRTYMVSVVVRNLQGDSEAITESIPIPSDFNTDAIGYRCCRIVHSPWKSCLSLTEPEDTSFILNTTVRFQESTSEVNIADIPINILDDSVPEKQKQFSVSVLRIDPLDTDFSTGSKTGALTEFGRESISITVFDNDFNVGFVNESVAVTPGGSARLSICVAILEPKSPDIDPTRRIPILVSTANASTDVLQLETNEITLSATNTQVCIATVIQSECENTTEFTIELHWTSDPLYKVNFQRRNLNITCHQQATTGVCQSCIDKGGVSPRTPIDEMVIGIVISVLVVSVIVLIIIVSVIAVRRLCLRGIGTKPNRNQGHDTS